MICNRCEGNGSLARADIITRKFSHTRERTYQLTGLAADEFKNGLDGKHFKSMTGDLVSEEFQTPTNTQIVLQQLSVHSYNVDSRRYSYQDAEFCLNKITSSSGSEYATSGLPFSKIRIAVASTVFSVAAAAALALLILL